jgi:hypothetical protein
MHDRIPGRGLAARAIAVVGVLAGHWLTYRLVSPSTHERDSLLAGTGHGYLGFANDAALVLALAAVAALFLGRLLGDADGLPDRGPLALRLIAFQAGAFAGLELLERVTAGAPPSGLMDHGLLPAGLAIQALIGLAGAALIRWILRAADAVAARLAGGAMPRRAAVAIVAVSRRAASRPIARSAVGVRGPPILPVP